jgi:hypothetical protein
LRVTTADLVHGCAGQQLGVVETAVALLRGVHGHRDHQDLAGCESGRFQSFEAVGQMHTQAIGYGLHAVVLEQMD